MAVPQHFTFSPDGQQIFYLLSTPEQPAQNLFMLDVATGATSQVVTPPADAPQDAHLSLAEELRRQRERMLAVGITQYQIHFATGRILIPLQGDLFVQEGWTGALRKIVDCAGQPPAQNAMFAPDGQSIAYVQDAEIFVVAAMGGEPRQITNGAREAGLTHGLAEYAAHEELGRSAGFWWSPDSQQIAFTEVDERHIPEYAIPHQGQDDPTLVETHRYPFAGAANAHVRLGLVAAIGGEPRWLALPEEEHYIARVFWWQDGALGAELLNRPQTTLDLVRFAATTGEGVTVLHAESAHWFTMPIHHRAMLQDGGFIWTDERSGFNHLYLYDQDGALVRELTSGSWVVDELCGVDEERQIVYFIGNRVHPTQAQLYAVSFAGDEPRRITPEIGTHHAILDPHYQRFIDLHSALDQPPHVTLREVADGSTVRAIFTPNDPRLAEFALQPPAIVELRNRDDTLLYGALYRPDAAQFGPGPYPTIIDVYGGPGPQQVTNSWSLTAALRAQYLRSLGFLVFKLDNRGSAQRGLAFEGALQHRMGTIEVEDQVDGVGWLVAQGMADPQRVGVIGWSYGGYMALMCLAKAPATFRVAVAGAPVTTWEGYDTTYTERYMATPQANPAGYAAGSVLNVVEQIEGKLLIIHGMLDENVHFRHTARLINALIRARKPYDLLIFPDERHMPRRAADRIYLQERTIQYFLDWL
jgi:dipeptidyl-peptidase-4